MIEILSTNENLKDFISKNLNPIKIPDQTIIHEHGIEQLYPKRYFSDLTTKVFTETIIGKKNLHIFVNYIYNSIYYDITTNINDSLRSNNKKPLNNTEDVSFIFKGGNIMNIYYSDFFNKYINIIPNNEKSKYFKLQVEKLTTNFGISDIDYELMITTDNEQRFQELYETSFQIIYASVEKIRNTFENLYTHKNDIENKKTIPNKFYPTNPVSNKLIYYLSNLTKKINYLLFNNNIDTNYFKSVYATINPIKIINNPGMTNSQQELAQILYVFFVTLNEYINLVDDIVLSVKNDFINLVKFNVILNDCLNIMKILSDPTKTIPFGAVHLQFNITFNICTQAEQKTKKYMFHMLKNQYILLKSSDIYSENNINQMMTILKNSIDNLDVNNKKFVERDTSSGKLDEYHILDNVNLKIGKKKDYFVMPQNNKSILIKDTNKQLSTHYISFNNTIKKIYSENFNNVVDFDLLRIKFDVDMINSVKNANDQTIRNVLSIPSELIDISIQKYNSGSYYTNLNEVNKKKCNIVIENFVSCESLTISYIIDDLSRILFRNSVAPWMDKKYFKRIGRLLFFIGIDSINKNIGNYVLSHLARLFISINFKIAGKQYNKKDIDVFISDTPNNRKYIIERLNYRDFANLVDINEDFYDIRYFVNFMLIMSELYNDDYQLFTILNYYRKMYGYVAMNNDDLVVFKNNFVDFLRSTLNTLVTTIAIVSSIE